jgi:phage gp16-like protein
MTKSFTPSRNALIGKVHVAKKQLALTDDSYRDILRRVTGTDTCSAMDERQLETVLEEFKRLGFKPSGGKRAGERKKADSAQATMIRALWLDLYHLAAIRDPSEEALAAFAKRSCGVPALQWLAPAKADMVINALRGWLARVGFEAPKSAQAKAIALYRHERAIDDSTFDLAGIAWKVCLIQHQLGKLGITITEDIAPIYMDAENLDAAIESYGKIIRAQGAAVKP